MDYKELQRLMSETSGNSFCPICDTPFKPSNSRQRTCGDPECKRLYHNQYVRNYNRERREKFPEATREYNARMMRKYRAKKKRAEQFEENIDAIKEHWDRQTEFEKKITEYGHRYGEVQRQNILDYVPKIDVGEKE